jgi:recombination protein RecA
VFVAKARKVDTNGVAEDSSDFTAELISALNREHGDGEKIAYNLLKDDAPTKVHRWISTGCRQLDYIIANQSSGGLPEGRIIEVFGPPGIGKSHIAAQIARSTQLMGGIVVYIDSENATSVENLQLLGVDIGSRFIYADAVCTEKVFALAESVILKTRSLKKDVPVTIIWDSVAATSPQAEINGDYDKDSIGLQARALSKGFRKITQVIGNNRVTFVALNQTRTAIGQMYGDNQVPSGGKAIPFHASVRIKLGAGAHIEDKNGDVIGIHVNAKTIKNKVSPPFRKCEFRIYFGVGIREHEELFDFLRPLGAADVDVDGKRYSVEVEGTGAWKSLIVKTADGVTMHEKKFTKSKFDEVMSDPQYKPFVDKLIDAHLTRKMRNSADIDIDDESLAEIQALADEVTGAGEPGDE